LFTIDNGNPFRRSANSKAFRRHTAKVEGWPDRATWHYLRHYAATRWIRLGVEVPTVSAMLGHKQVSTTYDWYVNVDADSLH
jgi:site-specific recombinase XerD